MTIEIINGDLLDALDNGDVNVIGHCCNLQGNFGAGIAKSIKQCYPKAYEADVSHYSSKLETPLSVYRFTPDKPFLPKQFIFNLYGQEFYGHFGEHFKLTNRQLHYGKLALALVAMRSWVEKDQTIGFPFKMGCELAGGDWSVVYELIDEIFKGFNVKIYKLEK